MEAELTTIIGSARIAVPADQRVSTTVIIPTAATAHRHTSLLNAIESAKRGGTSVRIVVVVNGDQFDSALFDLLRARQDISVVTLREADLPGAIFAGRQLVETEFFCFLDDDDEILPDGLALRLRALHEHPEVGFVASNGYYRSDGKDRIAIRNTDAIAADCLLAMTDQCWLTSCGGLYRASRIDAASFAAVPRFLEWTYLGLKLASSHKMFFLNQPTFRVYDSEDSLSKSVDYRIGALVAINAVLDLPLPPRVTRRLRIRLSDLHHDVAGDHLKENELRSAWRHHLTSLVQPAGLRYLLFSRRFIPFWPR